MHDIDALIHAYGAQNLPREPFWVTLCNKRFPKMAAHMDSAVSVRQEIEGHLRDSYEANLARGQNQEEAWKLAREHFGDVAVISQQILKARTQSYKYLTVRLLAIIAIFILPLPKIAHIALTTFFHPVSMFFMAVCAGAGFLITRKRDMNSLRCYAFYGSWLGLFWGIVLIIQAADPSRLGEGVAMILMATFYGLFLVAPKARGIVPLAMMLLCHAGVLTSIARFGLMSFYPVVVEVSLLKMIAAFSIVSVLIGLTVFDLRRLPNRLAGVTAFSMVFAYINILSSFTRDNASLFVLVLATTLPSLIAALCIFAIQKMQRYLLT